MVQELSSAPTGTGRRVAVVVARFNEVVTERLLDGALQACRDAGVADGDVTVARVPGAFELPQAAQWLAATGRFEAIAVLGAVVRGDTDHYDYVCSAATDGVLRANLDTGVPIAFGLLTCDDMGQALERAGGSAGNKGADAVQAALEMAALRQLIGRAGAGPGPTKSPPPR